MTVYQYPFLRLSVLKSGTRLVLFSGVRHQLSVAFGAIFTAASSWALGALFFRGLKIRLAAWEKGLLAGVCGAALLSTFLFVLCSLRIAYVPVFLGFGVAAIGANYRLGRGPAAGRLSGLARPWEIALALVLTVYGLVYLSRSFAPEISPDGATYHLGLVYRYYRQHGFEDLTTNFYAAFPQGMEMLFLYAFAFGRQSAAAVFHLACLGALAGLMICYGRRAGIAGAGACAAALVFVSPIVGTDAASGYNDVALATAGFAVFYLLEVWREELNDRLLIPAGLAAGFCFAIKYTGAVAILYALLVVGWKRKPRDLIVLSACAAAVALPWVMRNWMVFGNPFAPFFNQWFPNPYFHVSWEQSLRLFGRTYGMTNMWLVPWKVIVDGDLGGQLGPVFLAAPVALIGLVTPIGRRIAFAALVFLASYPQNIGTRFLIPALPFVAIAMAMGLERLAPTRLTMAAVAISCVLSWPAVIAFYEKPANFRIREIPVRAALGLVPPEQWLTERSPLFVISRMVDQFVPPGQRVWSTMPIAEAWATSDVLVNYFSAEGELLEDILLLPLRPETQPLVRWRLDFPGRAVGRVRLEQRASLPEGMWSIGELRFYEGDKEIKSARMTASTYPWDIALAADGNGATRWRTWERARPGMWVEAAFPAGVAVDRVEADGSRDQTVDLGIAGVRAKVLKTKLPQREYERRAAIQTMAGLGIRYLLMGDDYFAAADIRTDPARWGLELVADRGSARLYRIR